MNTVFIIPTGLGAEIGGHSGDGSAAANLLASVSTNLIAHPNVYNAADINSMADNVLYVEGSILDRFLEGDVELEKVRKNKILLVVNSPLVNDTVNAVSAARVTLGAEIEILVLNNPLKMVATMKDGIATGDVDNWEELVKQVQDYEFDALGLATPITVPEDIALNYLENGGVNPWGGVEAKASKLISNAINLPVAHAPVETEEDKCFKDFDMVVDPRIGAEMVSICFLHCILKGLHKAPRIGEGLKVEDIDVMVSPYGCWGRPHYACVDANIPIIVVKENKTVLNCNNKYTEYKDNVIFVKNYLEAVGIIQLMKTGMTVDSVTRPIKATKILK